MTDREKLRERIQEIVAHQFDLVTNLTQEAYIDSLKMIADQIFSLIDPEAIKRQAEREIFEKLGLLGNPSNQD